MGESRAPPLLILHAPPLTGSLAFPGLHLAQASIVKHQVAPLPQLPPFSLTTKALALLSMFWCRSLPLQGPALLHHLQRPRHSNTPPQEDAELLVEAAGGFE